MKRKQTIGVLTIPNAENYGSILQAFAMKIWFKENNCDVDVINYYPEYLKGRYSLFKIQKGNMERKIKSIIACYINLPFNIVKKVKFYRFRVNYIKINSERVTNASQISEYETVVVGGDQLWNTRITKKNKLFFLENCKCKNKIAFSVSMGYTDRTEEEKKFYEKYINNFDNIYIREKYDVNYINTIWNKKDCEYVLDPTLLIDKNTWIKCCGDRIIKCKYVLVYSFNDDENIIQTAKKISIEKGLPIYIINSSFKKKNKYGFINLRGIGPKDFITLIRDAEYIITNSFHGTVFSIIFNKKFKCVPYLGTEGRMISLLSILNLETTLKDIDFNIDYDKVSDILENEKIKARKITQIFLKENKE